MLEAVHGRRSDCTRAPPLPPPLPLLLSLLSMALAGRTA